MLSYMQGMVATLTSQKSLFVQDRARADKESQSQGKQSQFRYVNELSKDQPLR